MQYAGEQLITREGWEQTNPYKLAAVMLADEL